MTAPDFLSGGGSMGARIRAHDWSASPTGPPGAWPQLLRTALSLVLHSRFPAYLAWGRELVSFHNDAYLPMLGTKPDALGRPVQEVWPEIWDEVGPIVARALSGKASYFEDLPLTLERKGYPERTWWTFSYSPICTETGEVGGVLCIVHETTERVLTERRLVFLDDLRGEMRGRCDPREMMAAAAERLGCHLGAGRAGYGEVDATGTVFTVERDWTDGAMPSFVGWHHLDDFGPPIMGELRTGRTIRLDDVLTDPRTAGEGVAAAFAAIGMRACISAPFMDSGEIAATLYVHQAQPRRWRDDEVALMEEVAGLTSEAVRRARAERALRESEARLQAAIDLVGLSPYAWDPRTGTLYWDDRLRAMWGLPPGAYVDDHVFLAAIHPDDRPRVEAAIARCIDPEGDGIYEIEYRVIGVESGAERWISTRGQTLFGHGQPIWFIGAALDITKEGLHNAMRCA
uniref:GAF domain-containing protein n=1 Tax=Aquincola tertiaricarbonis TaxID=391953 RepID=UPI000B14454D